MELQTHDLRELAEFFAKRFPRSNDRRLLVDQLRLKYREPDSHPPIRAWMDLLGVVRDRRLMVKLGMAAQRLRPFDENLASMVEILRRSENGFEQTAMRMATMAVATLLVVGTAWAAIDSLESANAPEERNDRTEVAIETETDSSPIENENDIDVAVAVVESNTEETTTEDLSTTVVETVTAVTANRTSSSVAPPTPGAATRESANHAGRCTIPDDGVVGYWYAGEDAPGNAGEVVTVDYSINVRADYPDHHNAYNVRSSVRCQLAAGDQIRLTRDPILVPGEGPHYWVPLYNGDLLRSDA